MTRILVNKITNDINRLFIIINPYETDVVMTIIIQSVDPDPGINSIVKQENMFTRCYIAVMFQMFQILTTFYHDNRHSLHSDSILHTYLTLLHKYVIFLVEFLRFF